MQWVIDHALLTYDSDLLLVLALGFTLVMLFGALLSSLRSWLVLRLASTLNLNLGVGLLRHLLRLPMDFSRNDMWATSCPGSRLWVRSESD